MVYYNRSVPSSIKYILTGVALTIIFYQLFGIIRYADTGFQWCPTREITTPLNESKEEVTCDCGEEIIDEETKNEEIINAQVDKWMFESDLFQNDPGLIEFVRTSFLNAPSPKPYNLTSHWGDPAAKVKQHMYALKILKGLKHGFFVECGANNGKFLSSTLILEREHGWTGLLMEGDPNAYDSLLDKNRKAWSSPTCLSTMPYPQKVAFVNASDAVRSGLSSYKIPPKSERPLVGNVKLVNVTCLPLFTLLAALEVKTVDYFALNVEGNEFKVLKTIPFKSVLIKVITMANPRIPEGKDALVNFMQAKGYVIPNMMKKDMIQDIMFVHKRLKDNVHFAFDSSNKTSI